MDPALAAGNLPGSARLRQSALNRVGDQLLMPFTPRPAMINLRNRAPVHIEAVRVDRAECADTAGQRPVSGRQSIGDGDTLAALHQGKDVASAHPYRVNRSHGRVSLEWPVPRKARKVSNHVRTSNECAPFNGGGSANR